MPVVQCPYCNRDADLVTGAEIYPRRPLLHGRLYWRCFPCNAYVVCHMSSTTAIGPMANADLRRARPNATAWFDKVWGSRQMSRKKAQAWLAKELALPPDFLIGMLDLDSCRRVIEACIARKVKAA